VIEPSGFITMQDGARAYYTTLGDGPDVVCVLAGFYFEEPFARICDGRTFVLLHQRGRGRSEVPEGAVVDIPHEAADLDVVRGALGVDRWSVIGWSYMGLVAVSYALDHPGAVDRVVHLCSLGPDVAGYADDTNALQAKGLARVDPADLELLNRMGADGLMDSNPVAYAKHFGRVVCSMQMHDRDAFESLEIGTSAEWPNEWLWRGGEARQASMQAWDERERLPSLTAPMLVVHATEDLIPYRAARDTAALAGNARLLSIDGSGHWPWVERPDVLLPALDRFLAGEWPEDAVDVRT
jgi:proline iminopeptidase